MSLELKSCRPCSAQIQLRHMHCQICLRLGFRRVLHHRLGSTTVPHATTASCQQAEQHRCSAQLHQSMQPCQQSRCQMSAAHWSRPGHDASLMSWPMPKQHRSHTHVSVQTKATSSPSTIATSDSEQSETDSEADIGADLSASSLTGARSVDEAVSGYLQDGTAPQVTLHRSSPEALEQVEALILSANNNLTMQDLSTTFQFPLDDFQQQAVQLFLQGSSVLVCAPTGAGKTAIAEAAAVAVLARGQRVIYTTPLKALSNQKLFEMRARFGTERVGLSTGDASITTDAPLMIMTTEILRNIMYRTEEDAESNHVTKDSLNDVGLVVLDEVHYLGNAGRGTVWEEIIINCPSHIQLLGMSATVANPDDLGSWITKVHGRCETVITRFRPVPLTWHYCHTLQGATKLVPLLNGRAKGLSDEMLGRDKKPEEEDGWIAEAAMRSGLRKTRRQMMADSRSPDYQREPKWRRIPPLTDVIDQLRQREYLPAIWFLFSRAGCDTLAKQAYAAGVRLTTDQERAEISKLLEDLRAEQSEAIRKNLALPLLAGLASHHAGCLPAWKALVETCFQRGLLKVVFATETLAAGINMPARTTIISTLSRRRDVEHSALLHNEMLQMAGRAGRRGFDTAGNCVILQNRYEEGEVAWDIIRKGPERLQSQFAAGYGMVLNLLYTRTLDEAKAFIGRSFNTYLTGEGREKRLVDIAKCDAQAEAMLQQAEALPLTLVDANQWQHYQKLEGKLEAAKRDMLVLTKAFTDHRAQAAATTLAAAGLPWVVGLDLTGTDLDMFRLAPALAIKKLDPPEEEQQDDNTANQEGAASYYLCLSADNRLVLATSRHIGGLMEQAGGYNATDEALQSVQAAAQSIAWEDWIPVEGGAQFAQGNALTAVVAAGIAQDISPITVPTELEDAVDLQRDVVKQAKKDFKAASAGKDMSQASRRHRKLLEEAADLKKRSLKLTQRLDLSLTSTWRSFENLVACLVAANALEANTLRPLPLGNIARQIHGDNELWLAMMLTNPAVQSLTPPQLAGVVCALLTSENVSKPQIWVAYEPSAAVIAAVTALESNREALYKAQVQHGVQANLAVDLRLAGITEAWAAGSSWDDIMKDSSLDDGDIARLLSRTVDLLRHAYFCDGLPSSTQAAARKAMRAMNRNPIADLVQ